MCPSEGLDLEVAPQCTNEDDGTCTMASSSSSSIAVDEEACTDKHGYCDLWAEKGECLINPIYMRNACKRSCWVCVDYGSDERDLMEMYVRMDLGVNQDHSNSEDVKQVIRDMEDYATGTMSDRENYTDYMREKCTNRDMSCARWAVEGLCSIQSKYMFSNCLLACRKCHIIEDIERCQRKDDDYQKNRMSVFQNGHIHAIFENILSNSDANDEKNNKATVQVIKNDPWILQWDDYLSKEECNHLIDLIENNSNNKVLSWKNQGDDHWGKSFSTMLCDTTSKCAYDKVFEKTVHKISDMLQIPIRNFEYGRFVKYKRGQSQGVHHDYIEEDSWMPSGVRCISILLFLSEVDEGGAEGFPDLDWMFIEPKAGRLVVYTSVLNNNPFRIDSRMTREALPVVKDTSGPKYGLELWVHQGDWIHQETELNCSSSQWNS